MRIIAYYLPQYHRIPENDKWWGEGFTEWTTLKKGQPLFANHNQPRIPLHSNYYDLSNIDVMRWQSEIAKAHGVYGFCYYHYWFDGHKLLEKPVEQFLKTPEIEMPYCLSWANEHWTKAWVSREDRVLIEQRYGNKEQWKQHFDYLLPFFKDSRYIRNNGKPLFIIYRPELIGALDDMLDYWQSLARMNGIDEIEFASQHYSYYRMSSDNQDLFAYHIEYNPGLAFSELATNTTRGKWASLANKILNWVDPKNRFELRARFPMQLKVFDYDTVWRTILSMQPKSSKSIPGAFTDWDNTPRRGMHGTVVTGVTIEKFQKYFSQQIKRAKELYQKDMIFLFAWNEWTEGGYLEPDEKHGYKLLEAIKQSLL